ncbi:DUF1569 domain-containing protein [Bacteroidota bacterium]
MNNLYNKDDIEAIVARLEKLTVVAKREWGTMSVSQMLVHLNVSLEPAMGLQFPKRKMLGIFLSPILKMVYLNKKPMIKNSRTNDSYVVTGKYEFEEVKKKAIDLVKLFHENGPENCTKHPHPYFGKLTPEEWAILKWKHYDHHLRQFGV